MADNAPFIPDGNVITATDEIGGIHYQLVKIAFGALDSVTLASSSNPLPVVRPPTNTAAVGAVTVTNVATQVRPTRSTRVGLTIQNLGSVDIFWGPSGGVTTSTGIKVPAGGDAEIDAIYTGPLYCIVATGSADVRFWEVG